MVLRGGVFVKRFVAVFLMLSGLLVAGLANAAIDFGASTVSSTAVTQTTISVAGSIVTNYVTPTATRYGGFFVAGGLVGPINPDQYPNNNSFDLGVAGTLNLTGTITGLTCATSYSIYTTYGSVNELYFTQAAGPISVTTSPCAPAPTAQAVPTLSEWAQLMLGLMVISMLGWQWRKQQN